MKLRENIKSKVDKLDPADLRVVEILIDSLSGNRKIRNRKTSHKRPFYLDVIKLMEPVKLTSVDIASGREERI